MRELPAYSPLPSAAIASAAAGRLRDADRELADAATLIRSEFQADDVVLTDSGRSALRLAIELALAGQPRRRLVALPGYQCYEVATAAVGANCGIALYDIDPATLRPDLTSVKAALSRGAAALVVAPLYGLPVEWDELSRIAAAHDAVLIEDAAQADGSALRGHRVGTLGALGVVSFGRGKGWSGGGGGALLMRDVGTSASGSRARPAPKGGIAEWRVALTAMLQATFGRPSLYGIPAAFPMLGLGETRYHEPTVPANMTPFSAALLKRTIGAARREAAVRRENASRWVADLPSTLLEGVPAVIDGGTAGYLRFPLRLDPDSVGRVLRRDGLRAGIARGYPEPLASLPPVATRLVGTAELPGASALSRQLVTLPTHSRLTPIGRKRLLALLASEA